jgi:hypothetical protein
MAFEELNPQPTAPAEETPPPEESSNRPFMIAVAALGVVLLIGLASLAALALFILPKQNQAQGQATQQVQLANQANQQETAIAQAITQTSAVLALTPKATVTPLPPKATDTPVVVVADTATPTADPHTATVGALLTQAAQAHLTQTPTADGTAISSGGAASGGAASGSSGSGNSQDKGASASLPKAGFADEVGLPGLLAMAGGLFLLIFFARRLRTILG